MRTHIRRFPAHGQNSGARVLAFFSNFMPEGGAASGRNVELIRSLSAQLDPQRVQVVYFDLLEDVRQDYQLPELGPVYVSRIGRCQWFLPWCFFPWFNPFSSIYFILAATFSVLFWRPDIVVLALPPYPMAPVSLVARICGVPRVLVDAHDALGSNIRFAAEGRGLPWTLLAPLADVAIRFGAFLGLICATTVSSVYAEDPVTDLKHSHLGRKWVYAPSGVDFESLEDAKLAGLKASLDSSSPPQTSVSTKVFIYAGGLGGYYEPERAIPALVKIASPEKPMRFVLVGRGSLRAGYERIARGRPGFDLILMGALPRMQALAQIARADFGVYAMSPLFPDQSRALGVKCLEYLACGLPLLVIAPESNSVSMLVRLHGLGTTARPESVEEIDHALEELLEHEEAFKSNVQDFLPRLRADYDLRSNLSKVVQRLMNAD